MKRFNIVLITMVSLAALSVSAPALAADAASPTLKKIADSGVIAVGHRTSSVPFSYYDNDQKVVGFAQDICDRIVDEVKKTTKRPDLQVKMVPTTSQNWITLVQNGTLDLVCGTTSNLRSRQEQVAFSTTYFIAGTRLLVKKGSSVHGFPDLKDKAVVTNAGTTSERILRTMNDEKKMNMQIQSGKDFGESFLILESGRVAAFMADDVNLLGTRTFARTPSDWDLVGESQSFEAYGFLMRKGDAVFKTLVDGVMTGLMKSGEINAMYDKWFTKPIPPKNAIFNYPMPDQIKKLYAAPNDTPFS